MKNTIHRFTFVFMLVLFLWNAIQVTAQGTSDQVSRYLHDQMQAKGWSSSDIDHWRVTDQYADQVSGLSYTYIQQYYKDIPVYNAMSIFVQKDGQIKHFTDGIIKGLDSKIDAMKPSLTPEAAINAALKHLEYPMTTSMVAVKGDALSNQFFFDMPLITRSPVMVQLVYVPTETGLELAWNVSLEMKESPDWWNIRVNAGTGAFIEKNNYTLECNFGSHDHIHSAACSHASPEPQPDPMPAPAPPPPTSTYNVFQFPVEAPTFGTRTLVYDPFDPVASPFGWHDVDGVSGAEYTTTRGNNVNAYEDGNLNPAALYAPDGGASLNFDFPYDQSAAPLVNENASITNLFYACNRIHDILYHAGFTEAAGNFQQNNYGNGGLGNDFVKAEAFDGSGTNNANFSTPVDGTSGRMQMYLWNLTSPNPDGSFDNGIIAHEYGHGLSNRLTGGPSNSGCLSNAEQGGEGWSDWLALIATIEPGDNGAMARGIGTYALGQATTGVGIRRYPYSTNMSINPQTYADVATSNGAHPRGEIWCDAIWDMTWFLIDDIGFNADWTNTTSGNYIALKLVVEGMKLQPCSPGYLDARNAILKADTLLYGAVHTCRIWEAFARRGMGFYAVQGSSSSYTDQIADFSKPPICTIATQPPVAAFAFNSPAPCSKTIVFADQSTQAHTWLWDFGDMTTSTLPNPSHTYSAAGTYNVSLTVTNPLGTNTLSQQVVIHESPTVTISGNHSLCPSGTVTLDAGAGYNSYLWSVGSVNQTITVNTVGTYTVTVTDANSCTAKSSATTTNQIPVTLSGNRVICPGSSVTLDAGSFSSYLWSDGSTNQSLGVSTPGTYTVQVTDGDGCTGSASAVVTTSPAYISTVRSNPGNMICLGNSTTLSVDTTFSAQNNQTITIPSQTASVASVYPSSIVVSGLPDTRVLVRSVSINGLTHSYPSDLDIVLQSPTGTNVVLMSDAGSQYGVSSINVQFRDGYPALPSSVINSGTYKPTNLGSTDSWPAPGPGSITQATPSLSMFNGDFNGTWNLFVYDDIALDGGTITSWSVSFGWGGADVTYSWTPGTGLSTTTGMTTIASPAAQTEYIAMATDNINGCQATANITVYVNQPPAPVISGDLEFCDGSQSMLDGGAGFASYLWSNGSTTQTIQVSTAGSYTVTVTDGNGCSGEHSVSTTVIASSPVSVIVTPSPAGAIYPGETITFTATPQNPGSTPVYQWYVNGFPQGSNSPVFSYVPSSEDVVSCILTSSEVCTTGNPANSGNHSVQFHQAPVTTAPVVQGCANEGLDIPVTVDDFTSIGAISLTLTYLPAVMEFAGSTVNSGFPLVIVGSTPGQVTIGGYSETLLSYPSGTVLFTLHFNYLSGSSPLTWIDNGPSCEYENAPGQVLYDLPASNFYIDGMVTEMPQVTTPVFSSGASSVRCQGANGFIYDATASNTSGITYSLDAASLLAGNTINGMTGEVTWAANWYGVSEITAYADGCKPKSADFTVIVNPTPDASIAITDEIVCFEGTGMVTITANGGTGTLVYTLGSQVQSGNGLFTVTSGTYNWSVKDENNCGPEGEIEIDQPDPIPFTGVITYNNAAHTPMNNITINLKQGGVTKYTVTTGTAGDYA